MLPPKNPENQASTPAPREGLRQLPIESLAPNREQPRKHFAPEALRDLADSIKQHGIIQPLVVAPVSTGQYQIIAGERRWRAAGLAGLHEVPVVVREASEQERLELAIIENLQREDLNPIEEARALDNLMEVAGYTHEQLATRLGKDRSTISNALRLLKLPSQVQDFVQDGALSMGHARALLGLSEAGDMVDLAQDAIRNRLSVRAVEAEVRSWEKPDAPEPTQEQRRREIVVRDLEQRLRRSLGVKVCLKPNRARAGSGRIEVPYTSLDELERLLNIFMQPGRN
ncbi:MAG: ParB/RepB/Spo0J family partition protein [Nannocystaceae bacterium]